MGIRASGRAASRANCWPGGRAGDGVTALTGRCLPYGEGITYWPLAEISKRIPGCWTSICRTPRCRRSRRSRETARRRRRIPRARPLLSRSRRPRGSRYRLADLPPRQVRLETHEAWRAFFTGLTANGPVDRRGRGHPLGGRSAARFARGPCGPAAGPAAFFCPGATRSRPAAGPAWGGGKRNFGRSSSNRCRTKMPASWLSLARRRGSFRAIPGGDARASRGKPPVPRGDHPTAHRRGAVRARRRGLESH